MVNLQMSYLMSFTIAENRKISGKIIILLSHDSIPNVMTLAEQMRITAKAAENKIDFSGGAQFTVCPLYCISKKYPS